MLEVSRDLLTIDETAEYLRVSRRTVYRLIDAGHLSRFKVGRRALITRQSLTLYVNSIWIEDELLYLISTAAARAAERGA